MVTEQAMAAQSARSAGLLGPELRWAGEASLKPIVTWSRSCKSGWRHIEIHMQVSPRGIRLGCAEGPPAVVDSSRVDKTVS
jgi:hypothetical protein